MTSAQGEKATSLHQRVRAFIDNAPYTFAGLALAWGGLGSIFQDLPTVHYAFLAIHTTILVLLITKIALNFKSFTAMTSNPVLWSAFSTFPMALMVFSTYVFGLLPAVALAIWYAAILFHLGLMVHFTVKHLPKKVDDWFGTFFIVYVGIGMAAITSPALHQQTVGLALLIFASVGYVFTLPPLVMHFSHFDDIPIAFQGTVGVFVAPASLILTGYYRVVAAPCLTAMVLLCVLALFFFFVVTAHIPRVLRRDTFFPAYASFAFPYVVSAQAMHSFSLYLSMRGFIAASAAFNVVFYVTTALALCLTLYVTYRFIKHSLA